HRPSHRRPSDDPSTPALYPLSLHDALPISDVTYRTGVRFDDIGGQAQSKRELLEAIDVLRSDAAARRLGIRPLRGILLTGPPGTDRKSTRLNSSHVKISYAVFCLKKKKTCR